MSFLKFSIPALFLAAFFVTQSAHSEVNTRVRKTKTTVETTTADAEGDSPEEIEKAWNSSSSDEPKEKVITASFGSKGVSGMNGCKTEDVSKLGIRDLKDDCKAWIKDQRADLKGKYLTSSCEDACEDCGMSLRRCFVTGKVRYTVKEAK